MITFVSIFSTDFPIVVIVFVKSMLVNIECTANLERVKEKVAQYDAKQAGDAAVNAHKKTQVYVG